MKLTKKDLLLLHLALDITESDYEPDTENPEPYKIKRQAEIHKLRMKLFKLKSRSQL